jgi:hypothetical protein
MTGLDPRNPGDPRDLEDTQLHDPVSDELERYARATAHQPSGGFADRVMAAVEREPAPRRGALAWLAAAIGGRGPAGRWAQAGVLAATVALAVVGALAIGQLAERTQDNVGSSSSPAATDSAAPSPSAAPSAAGTPSQSPSSVPSPSPAASPPATPAASPTDDETPEPGETPDDETPEPGETPEPSDDDGGNSGPGGGDGDDD